MFPSLLHHQFPFHSGSFLSTLSVTHIENNSLNPIPPKTLFLCFPRKLLQPRPVLPMSTFSPHNLPRTMQSGFTSSPKPTLQKPLRSNHPLSPLPNIPGSPHSKTCCPIPEDSGFPSPFFLKIWIPSSLPSLFLLLSSDGSSLGLTPQLSYLPSTSRWSNCFTVVNILRMLVDLIPCWPHSWSQPASAACSASCLMSDQFLETWPKQNLCFATPHPPATPKPEPLALLLPWTSLSQYDILLII